VARRERTKVKGARFQVSGFRRSTYFKSIDHREHRGKSVGTINLLDADKT
jgi:hypothetical protein